MEMETEAENLSAATSVKGPVTFVLLGDSSSVEVTSENLLLAQDEEKAAVSKSPQFAVRLYDLCGQHVSVINMVGGEGASLQAHIGQTVHEQGIHAFVLLLPYGQHVTFYKAGMKWLKKQFGKGSNYFAMIVVTHEKDENSDSALTDLRTISDLDENRYHSCTKTMTDETEIMSLLEKINAMISGNEPHCYKVEKTEQKQHMMDFKSQEDDKTDDPVFLQTTRRDSTDEDSCQTMDMSVSKAVDPGSSEMKDGEDDTSSKTSRTNPDTRETGSSDDDGTNTNDTVGKGHKPVKNPEKITPESDDIKHQREVNELFSRLNLKHNYQNKLTTADFLKILPSIKKHDQITEKDVAHTFLQKLLMLDHRARYIPVKDSLTVTPIAAEVDTDDSDCDDLFSSAAVTSQSLKQSHVHPMDVQMAVFHCSDSFLRQNMISKLSQCQYALPLLVPDPFTSDIECPLWTFRQLRKAWKVTDESGTITSKNMPICQAKTHMVSFFRLGAVTSKSQLMNTIISDRHSPFFHRNCPGATKSHCLIDGMAEIAWYCPAGKPNDAFTDCVAFCNLHGNAVSHEKQCEILVKNSSVNVVLVPTLRKGDKGRTILSDLRKGVKPLICLLADDDSVAVEIGPGKYKMGLKDRSQSDVAAELKVILRNLLSTPSFQLDTMASVSEIRKDEADPACQKGKSAALLILELLEGKKLSEIKDIFLPCQGHLWHEWCKKNKDLYRLKGKEKENTKSKIESEMEQRRSEQRGKSSGKLMKLFIENLQSLEWTEKRYFLKWIGILLDNFSTDDLRQINQAYDAKWSMVLALKKKRDESAAHQLKEKQKELETMSEKLQSATVGFEHILREIGQMYEAHASLKKTGDWSQYPKLAAELMIAGYPMELMDGDAAHVPLTWITSVLDEVIKTLGDKRVFVLSVLGIQSSGKSTMLNAMFGLQFAVSAGRCTRGAFMQLVKVSEEKQEAFQFDYVLVVDTEGLRALELAGTDTYHHDNELATFVIGLGNMTLINIFGENTSEMQDILHIAVQAFMRMKQVRRSPNCLFVHQNVTDIEAGDKNKVGKRRLQEDLDEMTKLAAKEEVFDAEFFSDIIAFDVETDVKYFAQLWEGSPPMAPPNPGYSESVQELKDMILSKASQSDGMTLSELKSTIEDLWNALLKENFVFSFKNTREISLYRTLEEAYEKWTWALRKTMLEIEAKLHTRIDNGNTIDKIQNELVNGMNKTREEVEENMKRHFDDVKVKAVLGQWRGRFVTKMKEFHDELVKGAKQKLEEIIKQNDVRRKLDNKKTVYENKLLQESKELASTLKDKAKNEEELNRKFNALWDGWVKEFTADIPSIKGINIQEDVDSILQDMGIEGSLIEKCRSCGNYQKISNLGNYSRYVIPKGVMAKGVIAEGVRNITNQLGITKELLPYEKARTFIRNVMEKSIALIESKPVRTRGYNTSYLHEVAKMVIDLVKTFDSDKTYALKPGFKVDLLLHVFQTAENCLSESHKEFKKKNDPLTYLKNKKDQYYNVFKGHCEGNSSAAVLGEWLCSKLKESATQAVHDKTALDLADEMKCSLPPFSGNRVNLEKHVLTSLAEREDFDSYMNYIRDPRKHMETFIKETVKEYIYTNQDNVLRIMQINVEEVCRLLKQAVHEATETVTTHKEDTNMWLEEFSSVLEDDLRFDTNCDKSQFNDIHHFDFLKDEIEKGLDFMEVDLKSLEINMVDVQERPDQILIDHLCKCCWVKCPFCGTICTNTLEDHSPDDHNVRFHRSSGINGMHIKDEPILCVTFCTTEVGGDGLFFPEEDEDKIIPFKEYRKGGPEFANWKITPDESKLPYWKWFVCRFQKELEEHYGKRFVDNMAIPDEWKKRTREEAIESLKEM